MRTPLLRKVGPRWPGWCWRSPDAPPRRTPARRPGLFDRRERHPGAQDGRGPGSPPPGAYHVPQHLDQPRGRHRLPQGHDRRAHAHFAVATANPLATQAACRVLRDGDRGRRARHRPGVLGLAEPQSSVIGGGGFLLYYDAATRSKLQRTRDRPRGRHGELPPVDLRYRPDRAQARARASGQSIGVPGIVRLLQDVQPSTARPRGVTSSVLR